MKIPSRSEVFGTVRTGTAVPVPFDKETARQASLLVRRWSFRLPPLLEPPLIRLAPSTFDAGWSVFSTGSRFAASTLRRLSLAYRAAGAVDSGLAAVQHLGAEAVIASLRSVASGLEQRGEA